MERKYKIIITYHHDVALSSVCARMQDSPVELIDEVEETEIFLFGLQEVVDHVCHVRHPGGLLNLPRQHQRRKNHGFTTKLILRVCVTNIVVISIHPAPLVQVANHVVATMCHLR